MACETELAERDAAQDDLDNLQAELNALNAQVQAKQAEVLAAQVILQVKQALLDICQQGQGGGAMATESGLTIELVQKVVIKCAQKGGWKPTN